jgi:hypothetical protein
MILLHEEVQKWYLQGIYKDRGDRQVAYEVPDTNSDKKLRTGCSKGWS